MTIAELPARRPWIALLVVLGITAAAIIGAQQDRARRGDRGPRAESEQALNTRTVSDFGRDGSDVILLIDHLGNQGDLFDVEAARAVTRVLAAVRALPEVADAVSFDDIPAYVGGVVPLSLFPDPDDSESKRRACRKRALEHPIVAGNLLSEDARTTLVPLVLDRSVINDLRTAMTSIRGTAQSTAEGSPVRCRMIGQMPIDIDRHDSMISEQRRFQLIAYTLSVVLALLFFRGPITTLIVATPPAIGVLWTLGLLGFTGIRLNGMSMVVMPIIITMIGFTNAAHVITQLRRERADGLNPQQAIRAALRKLFVPCSLSALTTAVGFASLMIAEAALIRDFGRDCAIGTLATFIAVMLVIPLLTVSGHAERLEQAIQRSLPRRLRENSEAAREPGLFIGLASRLIDTILRNAGRVTIAAVALTIACTWLASTLRTDILMKNQLPDGAESSEALAHVDEELGGIQVVRLVCEWQPEADNVVAVLGEVEALVENEPLMSKPLSLRSVLASLPGFGKDLNRRMNLLDRAPQEIVRSLYRPDLNRAIVASRVQDLGIASYTPVFDRLDQRLSELSEKHPGYQFHLTGSAVGWGRYMHRMINDLARSLSMAAAIILLVITLCYRSIRIGLIAVLPNLFPLLIAAAILALMGLPLGLEIVCAFTICLGIAADDSIHFLSRYRAERAGGATLDDALRVSFLRVGQVLIITTAVMVAGLGSVLLSSLPMYRSFTAIACATLLAALVADLIVLPALLKLFGGRERAN